MSALGHNRDLFSGKWHVLKVLGHYRAGDGKETSVPNATSPMFMGGHVILKVDDFSVVNFYLTCIHLAAQER